MENTFEQSLKELEAVVSDLEKGDLTLENAIQTFEKGIALSKECNARLDEAEKKINILTRKDGEYKEEPFISEE